MSVICDVQEYRKTVADFKVTLNLSGTFNLPPNPSWLKYLMTFVIFSGSCREHSVRHFARDVQPPFHDPWELEKRHPGHRRQPGLLGQDNTRQLDPTEGRLQVKETRHVLVIATLWLMQLAPVTLFFVRWSPAPPCDSFIIINKVSVSHRRVVKSCYVSDDFFVFQSFQHLLNKASYVFLETALFCDCLDSDIFI